MTDPQGEDRSVRKIRGRVGKGPGWGGVPGEACGERAAPPRVLVVHGDTRARGCLLRSLRSGAEVCEGTGSLEQARRLLDASDYDLIVIHDVLSDGPGFDLVTELRLSGRPVRCLVTTDSPDLEGSGAAFASGAVDYIGVPCKGRVLRERIEMAARVVRREREREERIQSLREACRALSGAREEMAERVTSLCDDLVVAYNDMADQMTHVTLATEFRSLIQQELDVEALLRTMLEFMLKKTGPTNAAVFLPTGHSDYSLGAYINYDIPKDTVDVLLDHLADILAPRFACETKLIRCETEDDLSCWIGEEASWLAGSQMVSLTCMRQGEPLAIVTLFRDRSSPFTAEILERFQVMTEIFGEQLGRIIRVHNRLIPEKEWPGFEFEDEQDAGDDYGMAA